MNRTLAALGRTAIDLLYPPRCALCGRGGQFLCPNCRAGLPLADGARCDTCWMPLRSNSCAACSERRRAVSSTRASFRYEGDVRRLVRAFKFAGQSSLAPALGEAMAETWQGHAIEADLIVPVPLTGRRRRERGFNQSALLACELSQHIGVAVTDALARRHSHRHQAQSTRAQERWRNVEGAFEVMVGPAITGRRIIVVDDITTTGATLDACALALRAAGAADVSALTLARED